VREWMKPIAVLLGAATVLLAVTVNGDLEILGALRARIVDFTNAASTAPMKVGTSLPASCSVGQAFFKSDAAAGQNIYLCTSADAWSQVQGGASGGGGFDWKPSSRYVAARTDFAHTTYNQGAPITVGDFLFARQTGSQTLNAVWTPTPPSTRGGYAQITTNTTADNRSYWYLAIHNNSASSASDSLFANTTLNWEIVAVFRLPDTSDTSNVEALVGLGSATSGDPPGGVWLAYRPLVTGTNFYWQTADDGTWGSNADTGVAADTAWHRVTIRSDGAAANKVWLRLDNGTEISACPSGCTMTRSTYLSESWRVIGFNLKTKEAAQKKMQLDYAHFWMDLGAQR
jgi:hypothetical protein